MRLAVLLVVCLGVASPALAQECDVSTPAGDIFRVETERGRPAVGWDVKRFEHLGQESEHFSRPALSLIFALGADGKLSGPLEATVSITSNSDLSLGAAPPMSTLRLRAKADAQPVLEWKTTDVSGEALLAKSLREIWPRELVIEIVTPNGEVAASAAYDVPKRTVVETTVLGLPAVCFR